MILPHDCWVTLLPLWMFQIVIHALQCTHYVILWSLAKVSEGTSKKVAPIHMILYACILSPYLLWFVGCQQCIWSL